MREAGRGRSGRSPMVAAAVLVATAIATACSGRAANTQAFPESLARAGTTTTHVTPATTTAATATSSPATTLAATTTTTATTTAVPKQAIAGLLTFRGNATRSSYGQGPVPADPRVIRRFPDQPMCSLSADRGGPVEWCGTGWTGQPAVVERDGTTWLIFGAYDGAVHFVDAATGQRLLPDFPTGDLIKGSVTVDPDGFPLIYIGSRDNNFRVIAIDRPVPTELWRLNANAVSPVLWNDDWDGAALVLDDYLFEGGENSRWHAVKLNRAYGADGKVTVHPDLAFHAAGWDSDLLTALGDSEVSIEGSIALWGTTLYFANSGGLVQGWDISGLKDGHAPTRTFRFWTGDDTDATVVIDDEGMLYVGSEWERATDRARQVGQIMKLDPRRAEPLVWSVADQPPPSGPGANDVAGVWATPAIHRDLVIVATNGGRLLGIDRRTGAVRWTKELPGPVWQSPVVVDNVLLQGDCHGRLHAYDVSNTAVDPPELWTIGLGGCIESTPAVWKGHIYLGTRAGFVLTIADR